MRPDLLRTVRALASTAVPTLRIVGLVYTGLGGVVALVLVISVAALSSTPILQQVAEPARQAMTSLVQPTGELVTSFIAAPAVRAAVRPIQPPPAPFAASTTVTITVDDAPMIEDTAPATAPEPEDLYATQLVIYLIRSDRAPNDEELVEEVPVDDVADMPVAEPDLVQPAEQLTLQIATAEEPHVLPAPPPPATPQQIHAQEEAANHAAIEANKAAQALAKEQAAEANHAAIEANKQAAVAATMSDANLTLPMSFSAVDAQAAAAAANRAAIDGAKAAAAQARADAQAANHDAIAAAKAAKAAKP
jgi:colicin import membrane protein